MATIRDAHASKGLNIPLRSEIQHDTGFDAKRLEALTRPAIKTGDLFEIGETTGAAGHAQELARLLKLFTDVSGAFQLSRPSRYSAWAET